MLALALRIFAGVLAVAGVVTIAIMLTREVTLANVEQHTFARWA